MTPQRLEKQLNESLDMYNEEINFMMATHHEDNLTKQDMEDLGRQTFYLLSEFKSKIIKYLNEESR